MFTLKAMFSAIRKFYCMVLACCCMLPSLSYSAAWQFEPAIGLRGLYDDNVRLNTEDEGEDKVFTATLSPTLKLARYTDLTTLNGYFKYDLNESWGDPFNDKDNWQTGASIIRKGERTRLGLRGTFKEDTLLRSLRDPEVSDEDPIQVPDESVDDGSVRENTRRRRIDVRPTIDYDLTERWQVGLGYQYQDTFYGENDLNNDGEDDLFDFNKHTIRGLVSVPITEQKNKLVSTLLVSRFDSDSGRTTDNFELQAGLRHEFDETTNIILTLGGRYTTFDDDDDNNSGSDSSKGWVARLAASKTTGLTTFSGSVERKLSPSGVGDEVETDEVNFNLKHQLTQFISLSLRTRYFENESVRDEKSDSNRRFLLVQPSLIWMLTETWSISTGYRYRRQKDFNEPDSADSNAVFLTLLYKPLTELGK